MKIRSGWAAVAALVWAMGPGCGDDDVGIGGDDAGGEDSGTRIDGGGDLDAGSPVDGGGGDIDGGSPGDAGGPVRCGSVECPSGQVCCNASCGICTPPGGSCITLACEDAGPGPRVCGGFTGAVCGP